jgi:hypothetical protein
MKTLWVRCASLAGVLALAVATAGCHLFPFTATIEVENNTLSSIVELNISPSISPGWGPNQLDENISSFSSEEFTVPAGTYDLRAIDSLGRTYTEFDVRLRPDDVFVWTLTELNSNGVL